MEVKPNSHHESQAWSEVNVDNLKAASENALSTGPFGSSIGAQFFERTGVPVIRGSNLANDARTHLIDNGYVFLSEGKAAEFRRSTVFKGDLIFTCWGTINQVGLISNRATYPRYIISNKQMKLTPDPRKANSLFLFYLFSGPELQRQIVNQSIGSSIPGFNLGQLRALYFRVPTLVEQEAVTEALSDADALIESLEQLLTKKRNLKQGAMQQLLTGTKRLPGFSGKWEPFALGQMGNCHRGVSYNPTADLSPFDTASTVRLLRSNNVQEAKILLVDMQYVDSERVSDNQRLRASDILICMANGSRDLVGKAGRFTVADGFDYTFGAFMGCFRPNNQTADPDFVFYLFQTEQYRAHIAILLAGSSINNLTPGSVEALVIRVPLDRTEQTDIATILSDMDAEIAALETKLTKTRQIKQGMMQELLTGKTRLVDSGKLRVENGGKS